VAFWTLSLAVLIGTVLAFWHLRAAEGDVVRPPFWAGIAHATVAIVGLALLILVLARAHPVAGGSGLGVTALWVFGVALLTGAVALLRRRKRPLAMLAVHSSVAIAGYVVLLAWQALR
jgi:hypothetical protein